LKRGNQNNDISEENEQHRIMVSTILYNIFEEESQDVLTWYEENLKTGLNQDDRLEKYAQAQDQDQFVRLVIVTNDNGYSISIEITPESKEKK
jgi:hypothetical protein